MGTVTTTNQLFFLSFIGRNTAATVANDEHFLHRNKHETTRGRGFFHLFLMSSALSVGKLLLWNPFFFSFLGFDGSFTRYSPKLFLAWTIFYDVSLERKTALRRWNNKVIQLWGGFLLCHGTHQNRNTTNNIREKTFTLSRAHTHTLERRRIWIHTRDFLLAAAERNSVEC